MKTKSLFLVAFIAITSMNAGAQVKMGRTYFINDFSEPIVSENLQDLRNNFMEKNGTVKDNVLVFAEGCTQYCASPEWADGKLNIAIADSALTTQPIYRINNNTNEWWFCQQLYLRNTRKAEMKLSITGFPDAPDNFLKFTFIPSSWEERWNFTPDIPKSQRDGREITLSFDLASVAINGGDAGSQMRSNRYAHFYIYPNDLTNWGGGTISLDNLKVGDYVFRPTTIEAAEGAQIAIQVQDSINRSDNLIIQETATFVYVGVPEGFAYDAQKFLYTTNAPKLTSTVNAKVYIPIFDDWSDTQVIDGDLTFLPNATPEGIATAKVSDPVVSEQYYTITGASVVAPVPGLYIVKQILQSGKQKAVKVLVK